VIVLIVLLVLGSVALAGMGGWRTGKPGPIWDRTGRIIEPPEEEEFEKPRNEGDLL
jgi:hypothetical protein